MRRLGNLIFIFMVIFWGEMAVTAQLAPQKIEVEWSVQTNGWPDKLWVYKVVPQEFSEAVISNVMVLSSFSTNDRGKMPDYFAKMDASASYFGNPWSKHLTISSLLGYIEYHDGTAQARMVSAEKGVPEPVTGVPDQEETTRLGLKILRLLGIEASQLATKSGTCDLDLHWDKGGRTYLNEKTGKQVIDEVDNFGVFFDRRVDGLNATGIGLNGGVFISFGNNAKIIDLKACWRNLKPFQLCQCPTTNEISGWIRDRKILLRGERSPSNVTKLIISKAAFLYDGKVGDEKMDLVFPYAVFDATAVSEHATNLVRLQCPMTMLKDNWSVIK